MIINREALQSIYKGFKTLFNEAFQAVEPKWPTVAMEVPSEDSSEDYSWLGDLPQLREWVGDRVVRNLAASGYTIRNKDFEGTIALKRNDVEDDKVGLYRPRIQGLGGQAARHPDALVFDLFGNGFTTGLCYDGQPFFAPQHQAGDTLQSNRSNRILSGAAYAEARAQMMSLTSDTGEPLEIVPGLLAVPPQLEEAGLEILTAERLSNGQTNPWKGTAKLLVVPRLSKWPTYWFLMDVSREIKPFIFQRRTQANFVALTADDDQNVFMRKEYLYGVDYRGNVGYGLWQLAYGSTGEVA